MKLGSLWHFEPVRSNGSCEMKERSKDMALVSLFTALLAIGAFLRIQVFMIPFSFQPFFVLLTGLLLGARRAGSTVGLYLLLGLLGLPIFAGGGGMGYVLQPSFGYLLGFFFAACLVGHLAGPGKNRSFKARLAANLLGIFVIYLLGVTQLYLIKNFLVHEPLALGKALVYGVLIFLPSDLCHIFLTASLAGRLKEALDIPA